MLAARTAKATMHAVEGTLKGSSAILYIRWSRDSSLFQWAYPRPAAHLLCHSWSACELHFQKHSTCYVTLDQLV